MVGLHPIAKEFPSDYCVVVIQCQEQTAANVNDGRSFVEQIWVRHTLIRGCRQWFVWFLEIAGIL
jgi:hypothetical protein